MAERQTELILDRRTRLALLWAAAFQLPEGVLVKGRRLRNFNNVRLLVQALEFTPLGSRTYRDICARLGGISRDTLNTAIHAAVALGILQVTPSADGQENDYHVLWYRLRPYVPEEDWCRLVSETARAQLDAQASTPSEVRRPPPPNIVGPPPMIGGPPSDDRRPPLRSSEAPWIHGSMDKHGSEDHGVSLNGWPREIATQQLRDPRFVQQLYELAVARRWILVSDRLRFFALARSCRRRHQAGEVRSAGGAFTANVKGKRWGYASHEDEDEARRAIQALDEPPTRPRSAEVLELAAKLTADVGQVLEP